jgi:hypothetical protein
MMVKSWDRHSARGSRWTEQTDQNGSRVFSDNISVETDVRILKKKKNDEAKMQQRRSISTKRPPK